MPLAHPTPSPIDALAPVAVPADARRTRAEIETSIETTDLAQPSRALDVWPGWESGACGRRG